MTVLRRLAVKISNGVIHASQPALKDWARATSRELDFIESDWAALRWALGGTKVLWRCHIPPLTSLSQVPRVAQMFLKRTRVAMLLNWFSLLWMSLWFSGVGPRWITRNFPHWTQKDTWLGWYLVFAVLAYIACEAIGWKRWRFSPKGEPRVIAGAFRFALQRHRAIQYGGWFWVRTVLFMAGPLLASYHAWLLQPSQTREIFLRGMLIVTALLALGLLIAWKIGRRGIANSQRAIDELDELLATPESM